MSKTITVYEYDRLTTSNELFDSVKLNALLKLNDLHGGKYLDGISNGVRFKHFVGVIQVDGLTIEILPKADKDEGDPVWKNVLLKMLKRTGRLKASTVGTAHVDRQNLNLLEIYFEIFLNELIVLQRRGLIKQYRKESKNISALKGKLEFSGHIRQNLIHKERFYTTHQVYDKDHVLHQVLFVALEIVKNFTNGTRLSDLCSRVMFDFPEVQKIVVNEQLLSSIKLSRKSNSYSYSIELARLIILNYSPDISKGKNKMLSLLFDMNKLWEEFVLVELRNVEERYGISIEGQDEKRFWGSNYLKPDIVIQKDGLKYVLDTKWKRPGDSPSVSDLRQMYTYCRFWNAEKATLVYPGAPKKSNFKEFLTDDFYEVCDSEISDVRHKCKMDFISVLDENNNLRENIGEDIIASLGILHT